MNRFFVLIAVVCVGQIWAADPPKPELVKFEPKSVEQKFDVAKAFEKAAVTSMEKWPKPVENAGRYYGALPAPSNPEEIAFSPTEPRVALLGERRLQIWDYAKPQLVWDTPYTLERNPFAFKESVLLWSRDGKWLATTGKNQVNILDVRERKTIKELKTDTTPSALSFSNDGERLVAVVPAPKGAGPTIVQWNVKDWERLQDINLSHLKEVETHLASSGNYFLSRQRKFDGSNPPLMIWHLKTGKVSEIVLEKKVEQFTLHSDDKTLFALVPGENPSNKDLYSFDLVAGKARKIREQVRAYNRPTISPDGKYALLDQSFILAGSRVQMIDLEDGKEVWGRETTSSYRWHFSTAGSFLLEQTKSGFYQYVYFLPLEIIVDAKWKLVEDKIPKLVESGAIVEKFGSRVECFRGVSSNFNKETFANAAKEFPDINTVRFNSPGFSFFDTPAVIASLSKFEKMESLTIEGCMLNQDDLKTIGTFKNLKRLEIKDCTRLKSKEFIPLKNLQNLEYLKIDGQSEIDDSLFEGISELQNLKHLELITCFKLTNKGGETLAKLKNLEHLRLSRAGVNCGIFKHLVGLEKLKVIDTFQCGIIDADLEEIPKFKSLKTLILDDTHSERGKVTEAGLAKLTLPKTVTHFSFASGFELFSIRGLKGIDLSQLETISLEGFRLEQADIKTFANLPKLKDLNLFIREVNDSFVSDVVNIKGLERVRINAQNFSEDKRNALRQAMPNVLVR